MTDSASKSRAKWLLLLLALTAALFLVVASACGGDDDDDGGANGTATPTREGGDGGDSGSTTKPTATKSGGDSGDNGNAAADLAALAGEYEKFEGYVKYSATSLGGTDSGLSSMSIYQKGDNSRFDIESSDGGFISITTPDATYVCTADQCIKYPAGDDTGSTADAFAGLIDPSTIESEFGDLGDDVDIKTSSEKIAGVKATCFSATGDLDPDIAGDETGKVCFSESGLLLLLNSESGGETFSLEATEASSDVPDSAFEPPYPVTDLSNLGQ